MAIPPAFPTSDIDLWSDEVLADPYPHWASLRDAGPIVWLSKTNCWGAFRYKAVREVLNDHQTFSSAQGVMLNDIFNQVSADSGAMLCSDDPRHRMLRMVFQRPLMPKVVGQLRERLTEVMEAQIDRLIKEESFDAVTQIAQLLPLAVVPELVGMNEEGKSKMLLWAATTFNTFGPPNERTMADMAVAQSLFEYVGSVDRASLDPDGWGAALFRVADAGEITHQDARAMLADYINPSLDTTISALSSAILLFSQNPDQWQLVRDDPSLIPGAIDEVIRLYSPIRGFSRLAIKDYEMEGVTISAGQRVQVVYASGNRDARRYPDSDTFRVTRNPKDHVGFGYGPHLCPGMHLAKLEIEVALTAMAKRVKSIKVHNHHRPLHNTLTLIDRLEVTLEV